MKELKVAVFIEGSNIYFAQKKMGKWLDWLKVKKYLDKLYDVKHIYYYVGVRKNDVKILPFLRKLKRISFTIIRKQVKIIVDEIGRKIEKANFDVEITADILQILQQVDAVVLFSGDSDFHYLARLIRQHGKQLFVYSSRRTLSWELKLAADKYFFLEDLLDLTMIKKFIKL